MSSGRRDLAGKYKLGRKLKSDPSGTVYLAKDAVTGAAVTVKELAPALVADTAYLERFRGEAEVLKSLDDPNLVSVLDFIEVDGHAYVVSEYVEGQTLREAVAPGALPPEDAVALLRGSLLGLAALHSAGLVHGSLRPENVVIPSEGAVKVTGVDQPAFTAAAPASKAPGISPYAYIAPEQVVGAPADARTDVYLAGVLGFEMLAGKPPFTSPDPSEVMSSHVGEEPPDLSAVRPEVTAPIAEVVSQALAKAPDDRQQGAHEFIGQLDAAAASLGAGWTAAVVAGGLAAALLPSDAEAAAAGASPPPGVQPAASASQRFQGALVPSMAAALALAVGGGAVLAYNQRWMGLGGGVTPGHTSTATNHRSYPRGYQPPATPPAESPPADVTPPAGVTPPADVTSPPPAALAGPGAAIPPLALIVPRVPANPLPAPAPAPPTTVAILPLPIPAPLPVSPAVDSEDKEQQNQDRDDDANRDDSHHRRDDDRHGGDHGDDGDHWDHADHADRD